MWLKKCAAWLFLLIILVILNLYSAYMMIKSGYDLFWTVQHGSCSVHKVTFWWLSAGCGVIIQTGCLVEILTFILPAADEDTSELRSMCISFYIIRSQCLGRRISVSLMWSYCTQLYCGKYNIWYAKVIYKSISYIFLYELCCTTQGSGHSSTGGRPSCSPCPWLLVLQEEEWL